jgi:tetratricopeptide (TPR) repeat protein
LDRDSRKITTKAHGEKKRSPWLPALPLQLLLGLLLVCASKALAQRSPVEQAWHMLAQGRRDEAVSLLYNIIKTDPRDANARLLLGSVLMEEGQRTESIAQLSEAVRLRPHSTQAQDALGEAFNAFGEVNRARGAFEKASVLNPGFAQAQVDLGLVLLKSGQPSAAQPHLDRAIQLLGRTSDAAFPHYLRAKIYTKRGQVVKAAADLEKAVSLQPNFAEAWSDLGEARNTLLDQAGALAAFQNAVRLAANDPVAQTRLGLQLLKMGKAHEAVAHLEAAVHLDPKNQSALYGLERALRRDGRPEEAESIEKELTELLHARDRTDQRSFVAIKLNDQGAALEKAGNLRAALDKYRAALALDSGDVGIRVNYAAALLHLGRWNEGVGELRAILQVDPGNQAVKQALQEALAHPPPGEH